MSSARLVEWSSDIDQVEGERRQESRRSEEGRLDDRRITN
jgi:hypothetical protein